MKMDLIPRNMTSQAVQASTLIVLLNKVIQKVHRLPFCSPHSWLCCFPLGHFKLPGNVGMFLQWVVNIWHQNICFRVYKPIKAELSVKYPAGCFCFKTQSRLYIVYFVSHHVYFKLTGYDK